MKLSSFIKTIATGLILFSTFSCAEKEYTAEQLYNEYNQSVVLIAHKYYFEANCNDYKFYFVPDKSKQGYVTLVKTEQEAINNAIEISGTGFFIDDRGTIATNKHVAFPLPSNEEQIRVKEYLGSLKFQMSKKINDLEEKKNTLEDLYNKKYNLLSSSDLDLIRKNLRSYSDEITNLEDLSSKLNFNKYDINISSKSVFLAVGFNDTYITNNNDLSECVKLVKSEDKDLALIQLKSKKTPINTKPISVASLDSPVNMDDKVYMIGYNSGFSIAQTKEGIKSQLTSGNITQKSDGERILYSIPTLSGSSGSPIINNRGKLIGVNFAKRIDFQGFSYGVPIEHLVALRNEKGIDDSNTISINTEKEVQKPNSEESPKTDTIEYGIVKGTNVNVRPEPNTKNKPLDFQVQLNQKVKILEFIGDANREFLLKNSVNCNVNGINIKLNKGKSITLLNCDDQTNKCKIRFYDGSKYLSGLVPKNSIAEKEGSWFKIETEFGKIGWVYGDFINRL